MLCWILRHVDEWDAEETRSPDFELNTTADRPLADRGLHAVSRPLRPVRRLRPKLTVIDGPFTETKELIVGAAR